MSRHSLLASVLCFALASPAVAATHRWTGAVSARMSDPGNWIGGSPAGQPDPDLTFEVGGAPAVENDIEGLAVRSIAFSTGDYHISGNPIRMVSGSIHNSGTTPNLINCDLILEGLLSLEAYAASAPIALTGAISGNGGVDKHGPGTFVFAGSQPNGYSGITRVDQGTLELSKQDGVSSIPSDLMVMWHALNDALVVTTADEQIADAARVSTYGGTLRIQGVETLGPINTVTSGVPEGEIEAPTPAALILGGEVRWVTLRGNIVFRGVQKVVGASIDTLTSDDPASELHIDNWAEINGTYTTLTVVENIARAQVTNPNSAAICRGDEYSHPEFAGDMKSIEASRCTVAHTSTLSVRSATDLRLLSGSRLVANDGRPHQLRGILELNGATLESFIAPVPEAVYTIIRNDSAEPVQGTFVGLPEGALVSGHFRISYMGGDGNDVILTDLTRHNTSLDIAIEKTAVIAGIPVLATATVAPTPAGVPTGSVTFHSYTMTLGTADLIGGTARAYLDFPPGHHELRATYSGDSRHFPSADSNLISIMSTLPPAVISQVIPATVPNGSRTTITLRGEGFSAESSVLVDAFPVANMVVVSPNELRIDYQALTFINQRQLPVVIKRVGHASSEPATLTVLGGAPCPAIFDTDRLHVKVTPGALSAWLGSSAEPYSGSPMHVALISDDDRDGTVTWTNRGYRLRDQSFWTVVDTEAGTVVGAMRYFDQCVPRNPTAFPPNLFALDASGNYTRISAPGSELAGYYFMWTRPGVGAWWTQRFCSSMFVFNTAEMVPLPGSGFGPPPPGVLPGDYFVALETRGASFYGDRVDEHLDTPPAPGTIAFASTDVMVREDAGVARINVFRSGGTSGQISARWQTVPDSAAPGVHYTSSSGTVTFEHGENAKTIEIPILDNALFTGDAVFSVYLSDPVGTSIAEPGTVNVSVSDDEAFASGVISFRSTENVVVREDGGIARVDLVRTGGTSGYVSVRWHTVAQSAVPGVHFTSSEGIVHFENGQAAKSIDIPIIDNDQFTGDASFAVVLTAPVGTTIVGQASISVVVTELDAAPPPTRRRPVSRP